MVGDGSRPVFPSPTLAPAGSGQVGVETQIAHAKVANPASLSLGRLAELRRAPDAGGGRGFVIFNFECLILTRGCGPDRSVGQAGGFGSADQGRSALPVGGGRF